MQVKKKIGPTTKGAIEPHNAAYDPVDKLFRQIFGNFPSISNSWPGDYGKATLETIQKAQEVKYENYFTHFDIKIRNIRIGKVKRVLPNIYLAKQE